MENYCAVYDKKFPKIISKEFCESCGIKNYGQVVLMAPDERSLGSFPNRGYFDTWKQAYNFLYGKAYTERKDAMNKKRAAEHTLDEIVKLGKNKPEHPETS